MLEKPRCVRYSKRHTLETVLAGRGDECSAVDVLLCHGDLPEGAEDVGDGDVESLADGIQAGLEVRHGPGFTDDVAVEGVAVVDAETGTAVLFSDKCAWASPCTGPFFNDTPFEHFGDTFVGDSGYAGIRTVRRTIDRTRAWRHGERGFCNGAAAEFSH